MVRSCKIKSIMVHNKKKVGSPWNRIKRLVSTLVKKCLCNIALMNEWYARISTTVLLVTQDLCVTFAYFKETDRSRRLNHLYFCRLLLSCARCKNRYKTNFVLRLLLTWWLTIAKSLCLNLFHFINAYIWFFVITSLTLCAIIVDPCWGPLTPVWETLHILKIKINVKSVFYDFTSYVLLMFVPNFKWRWRYRSPLYPDSPKLCFDSLSIKKQLIFVAYLKVLL